MRSASLRFEKQPAWAKQPPGARHIGFSQIELLVAISIISVLTALVLPAIGSARAAARRTQCKNNLRNVGMAVLHATESRSKFPVAGYWGAPGEDGPYHNWVVQILPFLDQQPIANAWQFDAYLTSPANQELASRQVPALACPDDPTATGRGDLSYVVNGGMGWTDLSCYVQTGLGGIDLNGNGLACGVDTLQPEPATTTDRDLLFQMGLFFVDNWKRPSSVPIRHHTLNSVSDGLTHTIMLSENVHSGADISNLFGTANWASPEPWRSMFFLSPLVCDNRYCVAGAVDYLRSNDRSQSQLRITSINFLPDTDMNLEGRLPWPSSYHRGGVHVIFADGRVHFLSEHVNGRVYAALVSPQGATIRGPLVQSIALESDY